MSRVERAIAKVGCAEISTAEIFFWRERSKSWIPMAWQIRLRRIAVFAVCRTTLVPLRRKERLIS
jgi:hypothetical protein